MDDTEIEALAPSITWVPYRSLEDVAALVEERLQPPHDLTLALDLYLELAPRASQEALELLVARRIRPFETAPGFDAALARFAVALTEVSEIGWNPAYVVMLPLYKAHAETVSAAFAAAYPRVPRAVLQFLAEVATPASIELFRHLASGHSTDLDFEYAVDWLMRHRSAENDDVLRATYERTPENAKLVNAMFALGALDALEARLRVAGYDERNLILGCANDRGVTAFIPLMEKRLAAGTFDEALLTHLSLAGSAMAGQILLERERNAHAVEIQNGIDIFTRRSPEMIVRRLEQLQRRRDEELERDRRLQQLFDDPPSPDDVEDGFWDDLEDNPFEYTPPPDPGEWLDAERDLDRLWNALELAAKHEERFAAAFAAIRSRMRR